MAPLGRAIAYFLFSLALVSLLSGCDQPRPESDIVPSQQVDSGASETVDKKVLLIHNAVIHTVNPQQPAAAAMVFNQAGVILAVGDESDLRQDHPTAQAHDLGGATVIPGLIDSHGHLFGLAMGFSRAQLAGTSDLPEIMSRLRAHEQTLTSDDWLVGFGWDQNDWPQTNFPTRHDLDEYFPDRPVWLTRIDGHAGWANSAALALMDLDLAGQWQPEGGFIHRNQNGDATGVLIDAAMAPLDALVPPLSEAQLNRGLELAIEHMLSLGLTGVHDPGVDQTVIERYQAMIARGNFNTRVFAMTDGVGKTLDWLCATGPIEDPSGRLLMRATKLYGDGALGSRGAALLADYSDEPGNRGLLFLEAGQMQAQVERVLSCGFQAAIHAIGDRANRVVLDALQAGMARYPDNPGRHRVEHAQVLDATEVERFAGLDVIAAMQPTHATSDMYWAGDRLGPRRLEFAYAWRSLLDSGARVAFGSDFPVEQVNPLLGIHAAISRQDLNGWPDQGWQPQQRVGRLEALRGFTLDAAYAGFMEHLVGSLEVGKKADFVVLEQDLMRVPVANIAHIRVLQTWLDGQLLYQSSGP